MPARQSVRRSLSTCADLLRGSYALHSCSSSVSVESSAVYRTTDGQTDIFQTEKQRQKGTNPCLPEASSPFAQYSIRVCRRDRTDHSHQPQQ